MMRTDRADAGLLRAAIGNPRYLASCVLRVVIIWGTIRVASLLLREPVSGIPGALGIALVVCTVALIDAAATRELLYLRNLGLPARWLAAVSVLVALLLEAAHAGVV